MAAGFLDAEYGVADERRGRRIKIAILSALAILIVGSTLYFTFRNFGQERALKQFLTLLQQKDYQGAYKLWGCTPETPCKYYPPEKFTEDWGPSSPFANASAAKVVNVDACGAGVVFDVETPNAEGVGLWVERATNVISFAPWKECPGKRLRLWEFLKSRFS